MHFTGFGKKACLGEKSKEGWSGGHFSIHVCQKLQWISCDNHVTIMWQSCDNHVSTCVHVCLCRSGTKNSALDITYITSRILGKKSEERCSVLAWIFIQTVMYFTIYHCNLYRYTSPPNTHTPPHIHTPPHTHTPLSTCPFLPLPIAMSFPHDDSSHVNNIDEVSAFLNEKHPSQYLVFNLSGQDYDISKLDNQVWSKQLLHSNSIATA